MSPPGNEKPGLQAGLLSDDTETIEQTPRRVNGTPPAGHAWENSKIVPIVEPPSFTPEEKERFSVIIPVMRWVGFSRAKLAALEFLGGLDTRPIAEIARTHGISASAAHRAVKSLRKFLEALR